MQLAAKRSYQLLAQFDVYALEACKPMRTLLESVRYTLKDDFGEWCSRECRGGTEAHAPGRSKGMEGKTAGRKAARTLFCDDACRKAFQRLNGTPRTSATLKLSRTKPTIYVGFSSAKEAVGITGHPGTPRELGR
jgi:hypothetical protein